MDPKELDIAASVSHYGWTAVGVDDRPLNYVYSVGLTYSAEHPEIVIAGLPEDGLPLLKLLVKLIAEGESFAAPGIYTEILSDVPLAVRHVDPSHFDTMLCYASGYCERRGDRERMRVIQVCWPDDAGRFPFDPDCDPAILQCQPRLDVELLSLAVSGHCL